MFKGLWGQHLGVLKITFIGVPEGEERKKEVKNLFHEIMVENFPNVDRKQTSRCRKHTVTDRMNPRHIIIKMAKVKERIQKAARNKESHTFL